MATDVNTSACQLPIILIDDESQTLELIQITLRVAGFENVRAFTKSSDALECIKKDGCRVVLLDIMMKEKSGTDVLGEIKELDPDIPVIMATGITETEIAVRCMREGAYDYLIKPIESERLLTSISNALKAGELKNDYLRLAERMLSDELKNPEVFAPILTKNQQMFTIFKYIEAVSPTTHPVLITGETGTGKELIARAIHNSGGLKGKFVALNVAGLDDVMFSDVLFGHCRGSFTGADSVRAGLVESAAGGTLFLDEIGDLAVQSQVKLLRLIQQREYYPIGSDSPRQCSARIISATSKGLSLLESSGTMRKDLFYRLRTHHIHLPPLRKRKEDIELLVNAFVEKSAKEQNKQKPFVPKELYMLLNTWHFPGNIRELEGIVYDAMSVHQKGILSLNVFRERLNLSDDSTGDQQGSVPLSGKISFDGKLPTLVEVEEMVVSEAVERAKGNHSLAADLLGITRQSLSYRLKKNENKCN